MPDPQKSLVLIADDEPSTLALLSRHLRARGYSVLEATDGDEAWELAHEHLPNLVLLDVMMPGMSGWEVCKKIREAVSLAHTGVIMLTGIGESLNEMTSPLYGADAYVDKPFEFAVLDQRIAETIERRRSGALGRPDAAFGGNGAPIRAKATKRAARPRTANEPRPLVKAQPKAKKAAKAPAKNPVKKAAVVLKRLLEKGAAKYASRAVEVPSLKKGKASLLKNLLEETKEVFSKARPKKAKPAKAKPAKAKPAKAKPAKARPAKAKPAKAKPAKARPAKAKPAKARPANKTRAPARAKTTATGKASANARGKAPVKTKGRAKTAERR